MSQQVKLTKNELRAQQTKLAQLKKYLPTLQLKKALLQAEVNEVRSQIAHLQNELEKQKKHVKKFSALFTEPITFSLKELATVQKIDRSWENIAGVEVPSLKNVNYLPIEYSLFETPVWADAAVEISRKMTLAEAHVIVAKEKKEALENELREVSIRVNLFEKILIPRALANIKKIKVFLGDQQLAAVSQAKVAKGKIIAKKQAAMESIYAC